MGFSFRKIFKLATIAPDIARLGGDIIRCGSSNEHDYYEAVACQGLSLVDPGWAYEINVAPTRACSVTFMINT